VTGDLTLQTAGDVILDPTSDIKLDPAGNEVIFESWGANKFLKSSDYVSETTGWSIHYGDATTGGNADFRYIYADELHVKAFIAEIYSALAGALIITKSRARVSRDFQIPNTSSSAILYVEDHEGFAGVDVFIANDYILLRVIDFSGGGLVVADVYGQVSGSSGVGGDDGTGEQSWTFTTTTVSYSSGDYIYKGAVVLDYGQLGSGSRGIWEATVLGTFSPYSQVKTWDTITSGEPTNFTVHTREGHLEGITGSTEFGLFAGDVTLANKNYVVFSDQNVEMHGVETSWYDNSGNERIYINPTATGASDLLSAGPNISTDKRFTISGDGDVWLSSLAVSNLGYPFFNAADGILLLDFQKIDEISSTWYVIGSRDEKATVVGAIHQEQGRWPGTRSFVIEKATTNYVTNPSFEVDTTGWTNYSTGTAGGTRAISTDRAWAGSYSLKLVKNAGAAADRWGMYDTLPNSINAQAYIASARVWLETGATAKLYMQKGGGVGVFQSVLVSTTVTGRWVTLVTPVLTANATGDAMHVHVWIEGTPTATVYYDAVQVERYTAATSYCDGDQGEGYAWSRTAHASTSTRTATQVHLDTHTNLLWSESALTFRIVAQAPNDWDDTWQFTGTAQRLFEIHTGVDRIVQVYWSSSTNKFGAVIGDDSPSTVTLTRATGTDTFSKGDWIDVVVVVDFAGTSELWVNGEMLDDGVTSSLNAPDSDTDEWQIANNYSGNNQAGWAIAEHSVFQRALTAEEIGQLWALNRPLVDIGASEKPGIYILDGEFRIMSSTSEKRLEMYEAGIGIYEDDGYTSVGRLLGGFVNTTNKDLDITSSDLGWYGYDASNVLQVSWEASGSNAGKIIAGAGDVMLDEDGITLNTTTSIYNPSVVKWYHATSDAYIHAVASWSAASTHELSLGTIITTPTAYNNVVSVISKVNSASAYDASVVLTAENVNTGEDATLTLDSDGSTAIFTGPVRVGTYTSDPTVGVEDGMLIYRTDTDKLRLRANGAWVSLN
jgi:hypothetical protein